MVLELVGGAVLKAGVGELLKSVSEAKDKVSNFRSILAHIEHTLKSIIPIVDEISDLNHKLDLQQKQMQELVALIESGKALILKCSKISTFNLVKKLKYSEKLLYLDNTLLRYFMTILQLDQSRDSKELLVMVRELHMKPAGDKDEAIGNNQSESGNPRKDSGSGSHEASMLRQDSKNTLGVRPSVPYNLVAQPYIAGAYNKKAPPGLVRKLENPPSSGTVTKYEVPYITIMFSDENINACSIL